MAELLEVKNLKKYLFLKKLNGYYFQILKIGFIIHHIMFKN